MAQAIRIKRGLKENLPSLLNGELAFCTDTKELFIGYFDPEEEELENILVSNIEDFYTKSEIASLDGTGLTWNASTLKFDIDNPFNPSGDYTNLRARATTAADVSLGNVTNESKATMFTSPTFTGTTTIAENGKLVGVPVPEENDHAANKSYVDQVAQGIKSRSQALVLVDTNLAGTYNSTPELHEFTAAANGAFPTTDGVNTSILNVEGARIVLAGQTNAAHNGLYVLKTAGSGSAAWVLRRCTQCATSSQIPGSYVFVTKGTTYENTGWIFDVDNPTTFVLGTNDINVIQFSGAGSFTNGNGLDLTGNVFSLSTPSTITGSTTNSVTANSHTHAVSILPSDILTQAPTNSNGNITLTEANHANRLVSITAAGTVSLGAANIGTTYNVVRATTGAVSLSAQSGTNFRAIGYESGTVTSLSIGNPFGMVTLVKINASVWLVIGDVE